MSRSSPTPLARLVLFMVCLSVAGTALAGLSYYAGDLPQQNAKAPQNARNNLESYKTCIQDCEGQNPGTSSHCVRDCEDFLDPVLR